MIIQASFFWQNDKPGGIGFTLGPPGFTPEELTHVFQTSEAVKDYFRNSDNSLGSHIVREMLDQLKSIGQVAAENGNLPTPLIFLAAFNILWLSSRGFIPNDEFNGVQFVHDVS